MQVKKIGRVETYYKIGLFTRSLRNDWCDGSWGE